MKILAIVTLFSPPASFADNLKSYAADVDGLFLWDNTPNGGALLDLPECVTKKIVKRRNGLNVGIGQALNAGIEAALVEGYTHLLTMDQDSRFEGDSFRKYLQCIAADKEMGHWAYVPAINCVPMGDKVFRPVGGMIVSGTVFPVSTLRTVGPFKQEFVIDTIDTEYALRIHRHGGQIMKAPEGQLQHSLGQPLTRRILCFRPTSLNYSPIRTYYITRNLVWLQRTCPDFRRPDLMRQLVWKRPLYIFLIEPQKCAKLRAWWRGCWQGWRGKLSPDLYADQL